MEDLFCCCGGVRKNSREDVRRRSRSQTNVSVAIDEDLKHAEDSTNKNPADNTDDDEEEPERISFSRVIKKVFRASPDNKFALKLYGTKQGIIKEQKRQDRNFCSRWMIHPFSHFRWYWDLVMVFLLIFTITVLPVSITYFGDVVQYSWLSVNSIVDLLFILDIIINFRTGIVSSDAAPDYVILNPKEVAKRYLKGWFVVDFFSSIPFDYIVLIATRGTSVSPSLLKASRVLRILRLAKMLSLLKLLRISRLLRYIQRWEDLFNLAGGFLRIFKLIMMMLLLAHWNGCIQFLVPTLQGVPSNSWVAINKLQDAPALEQYSWSLFKAISHMLCIGFGRWPPQNITEVWLTIVSMMVGATFYALFIGNMSTLLLSIDSSGRMYNEKLNQVEEYMRYLKLPQDLRQRVTDYYEHRFQTKYFNEKQILSELSLGLQEDIANHTCKDLVQSVPFFKNASPQFVLAVITKLKFEVFMKNEYIIRAGTKGDRMFFIKNGTVEVIVDGTTAALLSDGSHFGEICLLTDDRRVADVVAYITTDAFSLSKSNFNLLLEEYPDMREPLESVALKRLSNIGLLPVNDQSITDRPRLSTNVPPPSIIVTNSNGIVDDGDLETIDISNDTTDKDVRRFMSEPVQNRRVRILEPPRSFSDTGKRKLPPLIIDKHGEPSPSNPSLIQYPDED